MPRTPVILPALIKAYGDNWRDQFSTIFKDMPLEEAAQKLKTDSGASFNDTALYGFVNREIKDFSFKTTGHRGKAPILLPAIENTFGADWKDALQKVVEGLDFEAATKKINELANISIAPTTFFAFCNKAGITLAKIEKPSNGEPPKKRGKESKNIPLLLKYYKTEDALKAALQSHEGERIKDVAKAINEEAGTAISDPNIYNIMKKYGFEMSRKINRKSKEEKDSDSENDGKDIDVPATYSSNVLTPVKFICTNPKCKGEDGKPGESGQMIDLDIGLALRARRCKCCQQFGTFKAQYKKSDGSIATVVLKDIDGITTEIDENEIPTETESEIV